MENVCKCECLWVKHKLHLDNRQTRCASINMVIQQSTSPWVTDTINLFDKPMSCPWAAHIHVYPDRKRKSSKNSTQKNICVTKYIRYARINHSDLISTLAIYVIKYYKTPILFLPKKVGIVNIWFWYHISVVTGLLLVCHANKEKFASSMSSLANNFFSNVYYLNM